VEVFARPEVTVLVPVHGSGPYLLEALDSLTKELHLTRATGTDAEALIVLDRPSTSTRSVVREWAESEEGIRVEEAPEAGLVVALNHGLAHAKGKYLARFDSDDVMLPGRLVSQVHEMEADPELVLIGGQVRRWSGGRVRSTSSLPLRHDNILRSLLRGRHAVNHSSCMMRTATLCQIGGYVIDNRAEDWDLYLRLARVGRLHNLPQPVTVYRYHADSVNGSEALRVQLGIDTAILRARSQARANPVDPVRLPPVRLLRAHRRAMSQIWYRRALTSGGRLGAWASLLIAGLLDPTGAVERCWRDVRGKARRRTPVAVPADGCSQSHSVDGLRAQT